RTPRPHIVHDLGGAARAVERVIDGIRYEAHVERLVVEMNRLLRTPAEDVYVRTGEAAPSSVVPRLGSRRAGPAYQDDRCAREFFAQERKQLPINPVLERADVTQQGTRERRDVIGSWRGPRVGAFRDHRAGRAVRKVPDLVGSLGDRGAQLLSAEL